MLPEVLTVIAAIVVVRLLLGEFTRHKVAGDQFLAGYARLLDACLRDQEMDGDAAGPQGSSGSPSDVPRGDA